MNSSRQYQTHSVLFFDFETDGLPREGCLGLPTQMTFQVVDFNTREINTREILRLKNTKMNITRNHGVGQVPG